MIGGGSLVFVLLFTDFGFSGAGPLAAIIAPFIAALCWKWQGWSSTYVSLFIIYFTDYIMGQSYKASLNSCTVFKPSTWLNANLSLVQKINSYWCNWPYILQSQLKYFVQVLILNSLLLYLDFSFDCEELALKRILIEEKLVLYFRVLIYNVLIYFRILWLMCIMIYGVYFNPYFSA